jgi:hypothetical protein
MKWKNKRNFYGNDHIVFAQLWFCPWVHLTLFQKIKTFNRSLFGYKNEEKPSQIP